MKVPYFVVEKDVTNNILYVANDNENKWLMNSNCTVKSLNWINNSTLKNPLKCNAKFRYRQSDVAVIINFINNDEIKVEFSEKIRAITPGQTAVFYDGDICLGGGVIDQIFR